MKQCRAKTTDGNQCRNKAIPGTNFCYVKSHCAIPQSFPKRALNYFRNRLQGIATVVFLFTTAVGFYWHWEDKKSHSISGVLKSFDGRSAQFPILSVGRNHVLLASPNGVFLSDGKEPLLSLKIEDTRLIVSTVIRNEKGDLIAELKDNEWALQQQPAIFDRNYTDNLLEVRDNAGNIALQVVDLGNTIHVAGIFHCRNGWTTVMGPFGRGAAFDIRPPGVQAEYKITPICEYPSATHLRSCPGLKSLVTLVDSLPAEVIYLPLATSINVCVNVGARSPKAGDGLPAEEPTP